MHLRAFMDQYGPKQCPKLKMFVCKLEA